MKVTYMPGIAFISGTMKTKSPTDKRLVFIHRKTDKIGQGRMYIQQPYERSTPVTTEEKQRRQRFKQLAIRVAQILKEQKSLTRKEAWQIAKNEQNA